MREFKASYVYGASIFVTIITSILNALHSATIYFWFVFLIICFLVAYDQEKKQ